MAAPDFQRSQVTGSNLHLTSHGIAGACEGSLACSTCHVVVEVGLQQQSCIQLAADGSWPTLLEQAHSPSCLTTGKLLQDQEKFDILPEADDDENDMLDLAFALTDT